MRISPITMAATTGILSSGADRRKPPKYIYKALQSQLYPFYIEDKIGMDMIKLNFVGLAPIPMDKFSLPITTLRDFKLISPIKRATVGPSSLKYNNPTLRDFKLELVRNPVNIEVDSDELRYNIPKLRNLTIRDVTIRVDELKDSVNLNVPTLRNLKLERI